ncbi:cysteinyl-tRNA synthetase [gamma proteobacterium HTCC2207]|uniref:Cysteine--tRNA ligase n=1 Tax=gamma proteobacterium HTCC2207 TaxID=314287 RepID=Q1YTG0_9GAMM|nr:cysteinyl-tRNA synthetase [gamma proteobacterium HTCC2207]
MTCSKQPFQPIDSQRVTMYVCGPTVYNRVHIGNARPAVVFDTLYRLLTSLYPNVQYARNITDIDDKIMKTAAELGEDISVLSTRYAEAYFDDMQALNNLPPTIVPYATQHIPEMTDMISRLVAKEHAYESEGHVLFAVQSMADYGKLSGRSLDDMLAGARVEVASYKKYAGDFILWKPSADDEPGWDSPWGRGRPGWHLECSAMIEKHLGESIDIHGGGQDLIFPHHENEIAQSCCAHDGKPVANVWMHNGFINIEGEKMSKSLGNFRMVNDLLEQYPGEVLRYVILSAHYRSEQNFGKDLLDSAWRSLDAIYGFLRTQVGIEAAAVDIADTHAYAALLDDLNTPVAISELHKFAREMNAADGDALAEAKGRLLAVAGLMGLLQQDPEQWFTHSRGGSDISAEEIEVLIAKRNQAKADKDYAGADGVREELKAMGVVLEDSREGTKWRRG